MYIIAGLGNPGPKYADTRHNAGFAAIDCLSEMYLIPVRERKFRGLVGQGFIGQEKVLLLKPLTYMNLSGESIRAAMEYFDVPVERLIVLCDDINLDLGVLRIRKSGSAGGHNGLKNIIFQLATQDFKRIRIGVGKQPEEMDRISYVLSHFDSEEKARLLDAGKRAAEAAAMILGEGLEAAMNRYNGKGSE